MTHPIFGTAVKDVVAERLRQVRVEGWTADHDDGHTEGQLAKAAVTYALYHLTPHQGRTVMVSQRWPWNIDGWKPRSYRDNLVRAAALLLAEIARIDRSGRGNVRPN